MEYDLRQWSFVADMNQSGAITISDVWLWFKWLYFYPGDYLLYIVIDRLPSAANFFEITPESYGGILSGFFSLLTWLIFIGGIIVDIRQRKWKKSS